MNTVPYLIPKNWKSIKLGNVVVTTSGGTPSRREPSFYSGNIPWVKSGELNYNTILATEESISEEALKNSSAKIFPKGTLLIALYGATIGKLAVLGIDAATNQAVCGIFTNDAFETKFLYHFLFYKRPSLVKEGIGGAQPNISQAILRNLLVPVPPITIQRQIVSKIEELFSELDKGIEQLKTAQQQLKTYRQAVLKWAFEGRLTNKNVITGKLPESWTWIKSHELFEYVTSGSRGWSKYYSDNGAIFLRITNLDFNSLDLDLEENKIQYVNPPVNSEGIRTKVQEGDFLFSITGYLGMFAIAPKLENAYVNQHIALCRPRSGYNKKYVGYWITSESGGRFHLNKMTKGATKAGLGLDDIRNFPIPMPPETEQNTIVQAIEGRLSVADKLEESVDQSLQKADALRQSILKRAFEGKLVSTDTIESIAAIAKVIPIERKVLAGKIIHLSHNDKHFGLTKFQKMLYLIENFAEATYETNFIRDTAGPYDKEFALEFRKEMHEKEWAHEEPKNRITRLVPGKQIEELTQEYTTYFRDSETKITFVLDQLKDKSTHDAELIATLYAVWNNRLIKKKPAKIDLLVEDFFNWSPKKKEEFQEEEIRNTYNWMKKIKFVPSGFGKSIELEN